MEYRDILERTELEKLSVYILSGDIRIDESSKKSYTERVMEADNKADAFFKARFPNIEEYNEIMGYYSRQTSVFMEVYFEIGLIVGGKLAFDISKRMEELK